MSPIRLDTGVSLSGKPILQAGIYIPNSTFGHDTDQDGTPDGWTKSALFISSNCLSYVLDSAYGAYALGNQRSFHLRMPAATSWLTGRSIISPPSWGTLPPIVKPLQWKICMNYTWQLYCDPTALIMIVIELVLHNAAHTKEVVEVTKTITESSNALGYVHEASGGQILSADWGAEYPDHAHLRIDLQRNTSSSGLALFFLDNFSVGVQPFDYENNYEYEIPIEPTVEDGIAFPTMRFGILDRLPSGLSRLIDESGGVRKNRVVLPFRAVSLAIHNMLYRFWNINSGLTDVGTGGWQIGPWWPLVIKPNLPRYPFAFYCNWIDKEFPFSRHEGNWISTVAPIYNGAMVLEEI